jgi:hypothetical protein
MIYSGTSSNKLIYGVQWTYGNSSPALVRGVVRNGAWVANNNSDFVIQQRMRRCVMNSSGVINYYLHPTNSLNKADGTAAVLDGTDGQVMVEVQQFYYLDTISGSYRYFLMSERPFSFNGVSAAIHP